MHMGKSQRTGQILKLSKENQTAKTVAGLHWEGVA